MPKQSVIMHVQQEYNQLINRKNQEGSCLLHQKLELLLTTMARFVA